MNYFRFFIYQFILFSAVIVSNFYLDQYISTPFTAIDLIAIVIGILIFVLVVYLITKFYKNSNSIRLRNKILLSIPAVILAILLIGLLTKEISVLNLKLVFHYFH